jgi:hypothetical protein
LLQQRGEVVEGEVPRSTDLDERYGRYVADAMINALL